MQVTKTFSGAGVSDLLFVRKGEELTYVVDVSNDFDGLLHLERSADGGLTWEQVVSNIAADVASTKRQNEKNVDMNYRFRCSLTLETLTGTADITLADVVETAVPGGEFRNSSGVKVGAVTEEGLAANKMTVSGDSSVGGNQTVTGDNTVSGTQKQDVLQEKTASAGVRMASQFFSALGNATGQSVLSIGTTDVEGFHVKTIEEVVDLTDAGAKFVAMTTPIPAGAVILSAQANIEAAVTAGGTSVKVGLGQKLGDADKYGKTSALTKNAKISTVPDWAVLGSEEQIDVTALLTDGSDLGDSNFSAGSVRVKIVYIELANLKDAA